MVDLTNCQEYANTFGGSEYKKKILYNGRLYMIKFPDRIREKNNEMSYMNNQFSEDIGCRIFKSLGVPTQNTFLGTYHQEGITKLVVACEDFTQDGGRLIEFSKLSLAYAESDSLRSTANIASVMKVIENAPGITDRKKAKERFWDMFVIDALIGNKDRNLDNFGFMENEQHCLEPAPVFDCGSSLSALTAPATMERRLNDFSEFKREEFNVYSCFRKNRNRILVSEAFKKPNKELSLAIRRIIPKIDVKELKKIIESTEGLHEIQREYITQAIKLRFEKILAPALKRENSNSFSR